MAVAAPPRTAVATAAAVLTGAGIAVQSYVNGRLGSSLGSGELAAAVNNVTGLAVLAAIAAAGAAPRALGQRAGVRPWHLLGGLGGALMVTAGAVAAPKIGVALLSVALVCGQVSGSLGADRVGLSPAGRRHVTAPRVVGVALAVCAVALAAAGARTNPRRASSRWRSSPAWRWRSSRPPGAWRSTSSRRCAARPSRRPRWPASR